MKNNIKVKKKFAERIIEGETEKFIPKKVKSVDFKKVNINPKQARHILKYYNVKNRPLTQATVRKYSNDIKNGDWKFVGDPIRFSKDGRLLDGQHRLAAVIETSTPVDFLTIYGLENDSFSVMDNGKGRTYGDILALSGYTDVNVLASFIRIVMAYERDGVVETKNLAKNKFRGIGQLTKEQVLDYLERNPDIIKYKELYKDSTKCVVPLSVAAFCYYILSKNSNETKAKEFLDQIIGGLNLQKDSVCESVYRKLTKDKTHNKRMTRTAQIAHIIIAWRRYIGVDKNKSTYVNWRQGKDKFPELN